MEPAQTATPFADLDTLPPEMQTMLAAALEAMGRHPEIRRVRAVAHDALRPARGQRLLDAGAGGGDVARQLGADVGPRGTVVALDYSAATTAASRARYDGGPVQYVTGDVTALDLADDSFDGVWCERVLQHVGDADAAIGELIRVTHPGGRVCLIDTDWRSLLFDGVAADLAAAVVADMHSRFRPDQLEMGRTLRRRLVGAGLTDLAVTPVTCLFDSPDSAAVILPMVNPRVPAHSWRTAADVRERWFAEVAAAGLRGDFLAALTIWVVAGTV
jgi:SAM-dependent methyltransferase